MAEALAPFAEAEGAQAEASDLDVAKNDKAHTTTALSFATETQVDQPLTQPSFDAPGRRQRPWIEVTALLTVLIGCVGFIWTEAPGLSPAGWPREWFLSAHLALLLGCVGLLWMEAAGWPVAALLALLIGCVGFIRMEAPDWPAVALLTLLIGFMGISE